MNKTLISIFAICLAAAAPASAASYNEVAALVDVDAFANADDDWKRRAANRNTECGRYGKNNSRRVDALVSRYRVLADAVVAGDEDSAMTAAKSLSKRIESSPNFQKCWKTIARREGLPLKFARVLKKI